MKKTSIIIAAGLFYSFQLAAQAKVPVNEASKNIGKTVTICDKVSGGTFLKNSKTQPTLIIMGGVAPNNKLTIIINADDRKNFAGKPEEAYTGKNVCVTGKLVAYKGKPEIIVTKPEEILALDGGSADPEIRTNDFLWFEQ